MNKNKKEKDKDTGDSTQMQTDGPADIAQEPDNTPDGQDKIDENDDEHLSKGEDAGQHTEETEQRPEKRLAAKRSREPATPRQERMDVSEE